MSTASPTVETIEEVSENSQGEKETTTKRGRKAGQKLFGHDKVYESKEEAESNEPYYAQEVTKKDDKGNETTSFEGEEPANGFRIYQVKVATTPEVGEDNFIWARNGDLALANWAGQFAIAELTDAKARGRERKIDNIYLMFFKQLIMQNQIPMLLETLKKENLNHYLPHLGLDEQGNKVDMQTAA